MKAPRIVETPDCTALFTDTDAISRQNNHQETNRGAMQSAMTWPRPRASLVCLVLALCAASTADLTTTSLPDEIYHDCSDLPEGSPSGVYNLRPGIVEVDIPAYCDMEKDGGGWTVVIRRDEVEPHVDFMQGWEAYKGLIGDLEGEFYWGNEYLWMLTSRLDREYQVHFYLEDFEGETRYALYQDFAIESEKAFYSLRVGEYSGDAGDAFSYNNGRNFSTIDQDNDGHRTRHCAEHDEAAWWFQSCTNCQLTGKYYVDGNSGDAEHGISWYWFKNTEPHSMRTAVMKIKPMQ